MDRPKLEVADIFRRYGEAYRLQHDGSLSTAQRRVMTAIEVCRTAALGGHLERCDCCSYERPCYSSCRDRHCPKCQSLARAEWVEKRMAEVLPTHYFHVVFSVPEQIASIAYQNKKVVYGILFRAVAETLSTIAADPKHLGAEIGFFAVLHSWGQNLLFHPHLHCVVPGGGISLDGTRWISCRPRFFTSLEALRDPQAFHRHLDPVRNLKWVVYAKPPFAGPQQVVNYVGRYTHRVAISNDRIVDIEGGEVKFTWRDYRDNNRQKTMTLSADQFIGRFLLHVLPSGFHRIRYYGFLANPQRQEKLEQCRQLLGMPPTRESSSDPATLEDYRDRYERLTGRSLRECPVCHRGHMIPVSNLPGVGPSPVIEDTS